MEYPQKKIALVHNSALPNPLDSISTHVAEHACRVYFHRAASASHYVVDIIDIAIYDIPVTSSSNNREIPGDRNLAIVSDVLAQSATKSLQQWKEDTSSYAGFIFLFPFHIWSYCNPLKIAMSHLSLARKPAFIMGFGKEVPYCLEDVGRTWRKPSYGMMKEFLESSGMKVMELRRNPEFAVHGGDYDAFWSKGRPGIWGQQSEEWESSAYDQCEEGIGKMIAFLEGKKKS